MKNYKVVVVYRSRSKNYDCYLKLPRRCFNGDYTKVFLSNYRIRRCEEEAGLCYGDVLDFCLGTRFCKAAAIDVYRTPSCVIYRSASSFSIGRQIGE